MLTTQELMDMAEAKGVDLSEFDDTMLDDLIDSMQIFLEEETGRIFEQRSVTQTNNRFEGSSVKLKYYPVLSIESIKLDDVEVDNYSFNPENGYVFFDMPIYMGYIGSRNTLVVEYTTCPFLDDENRVHPTAKRLLADLCFYETESSASGRTEQSVKEGDLQVTYVTQTSTGMSSLESNSILARLNALRRPFLEMF